MVRLRQQNSSFLLLEASRIKRKIDGNFYLINRNLSGQHKPSQSKPDGFASSPEGASSLQLTESTYKAPPSGELDAKRPERVSVLANANLLR